jgi:hypothetical protein
MALALSLEIEPSPRLASVDALILAFAWRPRLRAHCCDVPRPCRWISCKHNTFLDINVDTGELIFNHPGLEPDEVPAESSCVLDIVAAHPEGMTWPEVGAVLGVTQQRVHQLAVRSLGKLHLVVTP